MSADAIRLLLVDDQALIRGAMAAARRLSNACTAGSIEPYGAGESLKIMLAARVRVSSLRAMISRRSSTRWRGTGDRGGKKRDARKPSLGVRGQNTKNSRAVLGIPRNIHAPGMPIASSSSTCVVSMSSRNTRSRFCTS